MDGGIEEPTPHFPNALPQGKYLPLSGVLTAVLRGIWTLSTSLHDLPHHGGRCLDVLTGHPA